jgi:cellulose synthase/poly-beta-1,6-N-acetylglucosamine synthase-like glycosyltransferase
MEPNLSAVLVLWAALLLPLYSYVLFPLLIIGMSAVAQWRHRASLPARGAALDDATLPPVAIIVSAHNEEQHIDGLLSNLLSLKYPLPPTLYIGSDGSTDRTAEILETRAGPRLRVFAYRQNRGKASVLNELVAAASEPLLVFTDANTLLESEALLRLARHFTDPRVGAVCGELSLRSGGSGNNADGVYWRIERLLKRSESTLGALLGANGAIYAIRRECFVPVDADTVVDDFCIAMTVSVSGRLLLYEPEARALESAPPQIRDEFRRRVRIGIGNYQAFFRHPEYLLRTNAMRSFAYFSHKVLRWFTPHLLLLALAVNTLLLEQPFYRALWLLQIGGYGLCLLLYALESRLSLPRVLRLAVFLVAMNAAFAVGFCRYVTGQYGGSWKRSARA